MSSTTLMVRAWSGRLREMRDELLRPKRAHIPVAGGEFFPEGAALGHPRTGSAGAVAPLQAFPFHIPFPPPVS